MPIKPQDLLFVVILIVLLWKRDARLFAIFGLSFIILSIPLFWQQIFFTAQRFTMYAVAFISISVVLNIWNLAHNKTK